MSRQVYYFDKETGQCIPGYPPARNKVYGQAPYVITDTITPYYHPAAEQWVDSRRALQDMDKATGTFTTDKKQVPDGSFTKENEKQRKADLHKCLHEAVEKIDSGNAPLSEEVKEKCRIQNEITSKALNFDAFNVAGKKNDPRGKKYRRR